MLLFNEQWIGKLTELTLAAKSTIEISTFKAEISDKPRGRSLAFFFDELCQASIRGVTVRVILNWNQQRSRVPLTNLKAQRQLLANGVSVRHLKRNRCCHAKLFIVDSSVLVLGSHNLSVCSTIANFEASTLLADKNAVSMALDEFNRLFKGGIEF